jgi:hypothetical protein
MAVCGLDFRHKFLKGILTMPGSEHNTSIAGQIERQLIALRQSRIFDNRLGNPYR